MTQATKSRAQSARSKATKRKPAKRRNGSSGNGTDSAHKARKAVEASAKQAGGAVSNTGRSVGRAVRKAKTPLLASGAAVAGAAGGLALGARQARRSKAMRRPVVKVDSHDLAQAAKSVGRFGFEVGELASELRRKREGTDGTRRRSPIEVVLQGLTTRRG